MSNSAELEVAIRVLNANRHRDFSAWKASPRADSVRGETQSDGFSDFEAIAIAAAYDRRPDAGLPATDALERAYQRGLSDGRREAEALILGRAPGLRERVERWTNAPAPALPTERLGGWLAARDEVRALLASTPAAESAPAEAGQRAAFEAWVICQDYEIRRVKLTPNEYWDTAVQLAWEAWQAALAGARPGEEGGKSVPMPAGVKAGIPITLWADESEERHGSLAGEGGAGEEEG